jgi:predicted  nucleic acid-binding Zn-ribbon protein
MDKMELDIKASAKFIKVSRTTIYKKIEQGELSKTPSGRIDTAELLRVFGEPSKRDREHKEKTLKNLEVDTGHGEHEHTLLLEKIKNLESSLRESRENLEEAKQEKEWLRGKVDELTSTVKLLQAPTKEEMNYKRRWSLSHWFRD